MTKIGTMMSLRLLQHSATEYWFMCRSTLLGQFNLVQQDELYWINDFQIYGDKNRTELKIKLLDLIFEIPRVQGLELCIILKADDNDGIKILKGQGFIYKKKGKISNKFVIYHTINNNFPENQVP